MPKQTIILAAGCFWGVQAYFDQVPGVLKTVAGYTGGHVPHPTYQQVCTHTTGHAEAVMIDFDPAIIGLQDVLRHFFRMHDASQVGGQGPDMGDSYRSVIFCTTPQQKQIAQQVKKIAQDGYKKPIVTEITSAGQFYPAEEYHQKFFKKTGIGACHVAYAPLQNLKAV